MRSQAIAATQHRTCVQERRAGSAQRDRLSHRLTSSRRAVSAPTEPLTRAGVDGSAIAGDRANANTSDCSNRSALTSIECECERGSDGTRMRVRATAAAACQSALTALERTRERQYEGERLLRVKRLSARATDCAAQWVPRPPARSVALPARGSCTHVRYCVSLRSPAIALPSKHRLL